MVKSEEMVIPDDHPLKHIDILLNDPEALTFNFIELLKLLEEYYDSVARLSVPADQLMDRMEIR